MTRLLADTDALLLDILIPAAGLADGSVAELVPPDYAARLPFVRAYRTAGAAIDPRFYDLAVCQVDVWAGGTSARTDALDLAETCRVALYRAWERQTIYPHGSIASFEEQAAPTELRIDGQLDGVTRVHATYRLGVCPPG